MDDLVFDYFFDDEISDNEFELFESSSESDSDISSVDSDEGEAIRIDTMNIINSYSNLEFHSHFRMSRNLVDVESNFSSSLHKK
jgi:hypothetical protein